MLFSQSPYLPAISQSVLSFSAFSFSDVGASQSGIAASIGGFLWEPDCPKIGNHGF
jgi:hypothetical protein